MITAPIVFVAAGITLILVVLYYLRSSASTWPRLTFLTIRILLVALVLLAFFEPTFTVRKLASTKRTVIFLVDASLSMGLFGTDSLMSQIRSALAQSDESGRLPRIKVYAFGDSLRQTQGLEGVTFSDARSRFPHIPSERGIRDAGEIVIVSDGNWTNASFRPEKMGGRTCYYVTMRQKTREPFLQMETRAESEHVTQDSAAYAIVRLSGYTDSATAIAVTCSRQGRILSRRSKPVTAGYFDDSLRIRLPSSKPGTHVYTLAAENAADNVTSACYIPLQVTHAQFTASIYAARPSLDKRFLSLALKNAGNWQLHRPSKGLPPDIAFFLDWDQKAQLALDSLPRHSSVVFLGCVPCPDVRQVDAGTGIRFVLTQEGTAPGFEELAKTLPPPHNMLRCASKDVRIRRPLILGISRSEKGVTDTLQALYEGTFKQRRVLVLLARGLWRWDFWPASIDNSQQRFTDYLLSRVDELVKFNTNKSMYVTPVQSPIYSTDPMALRFVFPAKMQTEGTAEVRVTLGIASDTAVDSSFTISTYSTRVPTIETLPLEPGVYWLSCTARSGGEFARFEDSIHVLAASTELQVQEQNRVLLGQYAMPLSIDNLPKVLEQRAQAQGLGETNTTDIHIRQSWWMLAAIVLLLAIEWYARKRMRLD